MSRFDTCLPTILRFEGGFVNDPADPGGATNHGITQATYDAWGRSKGMASHPVREIPDEEVEDIYGERYWAPVHGDVLGEPLDLVVFDAAVNHGVTQAAKFLQRAVGATADGVIGPRTLAAVAGCDRRAAARNVLEQRRAFYADLARRRPEMAKFLKGWNNRLDALGRIAG